MARPVRRRLSTKAAITGAVRAGHALSPFDACSVMEPTKIGVGRIKFRHAWPSSESAEVWEVVRRAAIALACDLACDLGLDVEIYRVDGTTRYLTIRGVSRGAGPRLP